MTRKPVIHYQSGCSNRINASAVICMRGTVLGEYYTFEWKSIQGVVLKATYNSTCDSLEYIPSGSYVVKITGVTGCDTSINLYIPPAPPVKASFAIDSFLCEAQE